MICKVYQYCDNPNNLLLVSPNDTVINGEWPLDYARRNNFKIMMIGYIDYDGDYSNTLCRFRQGERILLNKCSCGETITGYKKINEQASSIRPNS